MRGEEHGGLSQDPSPDTTELDHGSISQPLKSSCPGAKKASSWAVRMEWEAEVNH